jgi:putative flippase GtrA
MSSRRPRAAFFDFALLGRHQLAAFVATSVDFSVMIALVEIVRLRPPPATLLSAVAGAIVNFVLSRVWAYRARHGGTVASQAARYAVVALGGALVNAALLALALRLTRGYAALRAIIAILVSVLYTYPLHTRLVFRVGR